MKIIIQVSGEQNQTKSDKKLLYDKFWKKKLSNKSQKEKHEKLTHHSEEEKFK